MSRPTVHRLRCEHRADPLGIDADPPRLSWQVAAEARGTEQSGYQVVVRSGGEVLWDSGRVASADSVLVPYGGPPLRSRQRCEWTVRVWDGSGRVSDWAEPAWWETGLLAPADWTARWIGVPAGHGDGDVTLLRSELTLPGRVVRARAYATALGLFELHCNGVRVGDERLAPGWTDYQVRLHYRTYDVTALLREGVNTVGVVLAEGWYAGWLGFAGEREHYGGVPEVLVQLEVETADGTVVRHGTDGTWTTGRGGWTSADLLMGERFDARAHDPAWCTPGAAAGEWRPAVVRGGTRGRLEADPGPPVRVTGEVEPVSVTERAPGRWIADLGQNLVGVVRLRVSGEAGTVVTLRHAEMLSPDGELYVDNLRAARATDEYTLRGGGPEVWEPSFTLHGFRYVELSGYPGPPGPGAVTGVVVGSDVPFTIGFTCSDERLNRLHANVGWGLRGNFVSVPTDCPQRDERLGWTGDAQLFAPTACYVADAAGFLTKWLRDVRDAQSAEGAFPDVAPRAVQMTDGAPAWGDAGVIVPWTVYQAYGDVRVLEEGYPAMRRWVGYVDAANPDHLWRHRRNNDYGDWLSIGADTDKELLATAFFARSTELTARTAAALGRDDEAAELWALHDGIGRAFRAAYLTGDGRLTSGTQTAYALALRFGLVPAALRPLAAGHLAADVEARQHLSTGFVGVGHLLPALGETGRGDLAHRLLLTDSYPSWLYSIDCGATTMWERWDGWTHDRGFQTPVMNSFNHYAFGAVGEWLYGGLGGIRPDPAGPGFRRCVIGPEPGPGIDGATTTFRSIRGEIGCAWRREADALVVEVTVPVGCTATVLLPVPPGAEVTEGGRPAAGAPGVTPLGRRGAAEAFEVGSGRYAFRGEGSGAPAAPSAR